jgi:outer membrane protein OmpA-like peptidoglycan-associated protein
MKQSKDFFWPSYVDLMTALFLTMLVLFVLSYKLFKDKQRDNDKLIYDLKVQVQEKRKLDEIKEALKRLESDYFTYNQRYKRYELNFPVTFAPKSDVLPTEAQAPLVKAGRFLLSQMQALKTDDQVQYLIVVEGRAAKDLRYPATDPHNLDGPAVRELSYNRAMAVIRLWEQAGLRFPANLEVVAAGSGFRGAGRYTGTEEAKNKRFIIQVQPKIGSIGK